MAGTASEPNETLIVSYARMSDVLKMAIRVLASPCASNEVAEAVGELVAEHARFNMWVVGTAKRTLDDVAFDEVLELAENVETSTSAAWARWEGRQEDIAERRQLESTVRDWTTRLREIQVRNRSET